MAKEKIKRGFDADFDTFWKEMLDMVEPAVLFFLPDLHAAITIQRKSTKTVRTQEKTIGALESERNFVGQV